MIPAATQTLTLNGQPQPYRAQTVRELLLAQGLDPEPPGIAVAVNAVVVRRAEWETTQLQPDDRVEIIKATAGG